LLALSASLLGLYYGDQLGGVVAREVDAFAPGLAEGLELETILEKNRSSLGLAGLASLGVCCSPGSAGSTPCARPSAPCGTRTSRPATSSRRRPSTSSSWPGSASP
jgi:hypothetical protein